MAILNNRLEQLPGASAQPKVAGNLGQWRPDVSAMVMGLPILMI